MTTNRPDFLIYGANGYTGELTARLAVKQGMRPILAGRNASAIERLADELDLPHRLFALEDPGIIDSAIGDVGVVVHCAGPFWRTAAPMADACLRNRCHYIDITGEIEVFEALARRYDEARAAGVLLLPGAGFDVVPSDCLAAHLAQQLPSATHLTLAFEGSGGASHGTLTTMIEQMGRGGRGMIRRNERLVQVPMGWKTREVDFGRGPRPTMTIPWGDVSTAYHSTGIPNIEVYMALPSSLIRANFLMRYVGWLMRLESAQRLAIKAVRAGPAGPTQSSLLKEECRLWGMVEDRTSGTAIEARLRTPEAYLLTAQASLAAVKHVLAGDAPTGYHTPSSAFGADFVMEIDGVTRVAA